MTPAYEYLRARLIREKARLTQHADKGAAEVEKVRRAFAEFDAELEAEALWFAKWEQQFHPSNGGAL